MARYYFYVLEKMRIENFILSIVKKLSDILLSRIDSLSDEELFQSTQMNNIDTVPYVKRLSEHNHPTALCRYAWILYRGEENHGVQRDLEVSKNI